jgi:hypothetical protein
MNSSSSRYTTSRSRSRTYSRDRTNRGKRSYSSLSHSSQDSTKKLTRKKRRWTTVGTRSVSPRSITWPTVRTRSRTWTRVIRGITIWSTSWTTWTIKIWTVAWMTRLWSRSWPTSFTRVITKDKPVNLVIVKLHLVLSRNKNLHWVFQKNLKNLSLSNRKILGAKLKIFMSQRSGEIPNLNGIRVIVTVKTKWILWWSRKNWKRK